MSDPPPIPPELERFQQRATWPFLLGVYMGINATRDAYLIIDSPDCAFFKTEHIQGNHDRASDLMDCLGHHRIINTRADVGNIIDDRRTLVQEIAQDVYDDAGTAALFVTSMPMAMITGVEYGLLTRTCQERSDVFKPAAEIPCASLAGDWLDGYGDYLVALAGALELDGSARRPGSVALIGNLMDRVEADCLANAAELRRMVEALGLEVTSVWLDGGSIADLTRVQEADLLISLPYGRAAAELLAERTGARVLELDLPLGIGRSEAWIRALAQATDRTEEAEHFLAAELSTIARRLEWVLPSKIMGKRLVVSAGPHVVHALVDFFEELGAQVTLGISFGRKEHVGADTPEATLGRTRVLYEPSMGALYRALRQAFSTAERPDLLLGNSLTFEAAAMDWPTFLEFGYPSYRTSQVFEAPFLGLRGALWLAGAVANRVGLLETIETYRPSKPPSSGIDLRGLVKRSR